jgi:hypothetical protein
MAGLSIDLLRRKRLNMMPLLSGAATISALEAISPNVRVIAASGLYGSHQANN